MIRTVFFDLDDTLLDFHAAERAAMTATLRELGIDPAPAVLSRYSDGNVSSGYTRTTGRVSQVLKGQAPEQLVITEECYTLDDALWTQGGYLPMEKGRPYLLFLTAYPGGSDYAGMYYPTELELGKYPLTDQPLTASDPAGAWQVYSPDGSALSRYQSWYQQVAALYPDLF